jgi:O-antigen ligase
MGLQMFSDSPIWGQGFEGFMLQSPMYGRQYGVLVRKGPHSVPLRALAETGIVGVLVLVWMAVVTLRTGLHVLRLEGRDRDVGVFFMSVYSCIFVASFFGNVLNHSQITFFFWVVFGSVAAARFDVPVEDVEESVPEYAPEGLAFAK